MPFRFRRLRKSPSIRHLVQESHLLCDDIIAPFFVTEGKNVQQEIPSMPGIYRFSVDRLIKQVDLLIKMGGRAIILFGVVSKKDNTGRFSYSAKNPVVLAIKALRKLYPHLVIMSDVCLCAYMTHGHCGIVHGHVIDNDVTLPVLSRMALAHAEAGVDFVAPSDMMDFRIAKIREKLNNQGFTQVGILSYAVKYASAYYGPFRDAAHSAPLFGDRRSYQMDPANQREAMKEALQDIQEGADMIMVKPALAYLDIIHALREKIQQPLVAYNVSGEYSMIKAAAQKGWIDEQAIIHETLLGMKRAGADLIITYHAFDILKILSK